MNTVRPIACTPARRALPCIWLTVLVLAIGLYATAARAALHDRVVARAYLVDPSGSLGYPDVSRATFTPYPEALLFTGLGTGTLWLRLTLEGNGTDLANPAPWVLRVNETFFDRIEVYDEATPGPPQVDGFYTDATQSPRFSMGYAFPLPTRPMPRTVYVRIQTDGLLAATTNVVSEADAVWMEKAAVLYSLLAILLLAALAATAFIYWRQFPSRVGLALAIKQLLCLASAVLLWNYPRILWGGVGAHRALLALSYLTVALSSAASAWFVREYLRDVRPSGRGHHLFTAIALSQVIAALIALSPWQAFGLRLTTIALVAATLLTFTSMVTARASAPRLSMAWWRWRARRLADGVFLGAAVFCAYPVKLSLNNTPVLTGLNFLMLAFSTYFVLAVTQRRVRARRDATHRREAELEAARERATEAEEQRRQKEVFLAMLSHELKTPLTILRILISTRAPTAKTQSQAIDAIDNIRRILTRCTEAERIGANTHLAQHKALSLRALADAAIQERDAARIVFDMPPATDVTLRSDEDMIRVILGNLLDNALRYADPDTTIKFTIDAAAMHERAGFEIRIKNLIGRAGAPDPSTLFEKYARGAKVHGISGTGLGLYISKELSALIGAALTLQLDTQSVTFSLWIPASVDPKERS